MAHALTLTLTFTLTLTLALTLTRTLTLTHTLTLTLTLTLRPHTHTHTHTHTQTSHSRIAYAHLLQDLVDDEVAPVLVGLLRVVLKDAIESHLRRGIRRLVGLQTAVEILQDE